MAIITEWNNWPLLKDIAHFFQKWSIPENIGERGRYGRDFQYYLALTSFEEFGYFKS